MHSVLPGKQFPKTAEATFTQPDLPSAKKPQKNCAKMAQTFLYTQTFLYITGKFCCMHREGKFLCNGSS
jgi:hypothetical protein